MQCACKHTLAAVLTLTLLLTGCVKLKQALTLMPDGSGKMQMTFALNAQLVDLAKQNKEDPFKEVVPQAMKGKAQGVVAFSEPEREEHDGFSYLTYTMYFRDINKVRIADLGEGRPARYIYTREGEGATLTLTGGPILSIIPEHQPTPQEEREQTRATMTGLSFSQTFALPGEISPIKGVRVEKNKAELLLTLEDYLAGTGPISDLKDVKSLKFELAQVKAEDAAVAAFKKELEEAVAAWEATQN